MSSGAFCPTSTAAFMKIAPEFVNGGAVRPSLEIDEPVIAGIAPFPVQSRPFLRRIKTHASELPIKQVRLLALIPIRFNANPFLVFADALDFLHRGFKFIHVQIVEGVYRENKIEAVRIIG